MNQKTSKDDWKPSFWEVASSRSWTEHLVMYFVTFGVILYFIVSPQNWLGWTFTIGMALILTFAYWCLMINVNKAYIHKEYGKLKMQEQQLEDIKQQIKDLESKNDVSSNTNTSQNNPTAQ